MARRMRAAFLILGLTTALCGNGFPAACDAVITKSGAIIDYGPPAVAPKALFTSDPVYPKSALKDKMKGTVRLFIVVGTDGRVHDARVLKSLRKDFDDSALDAVQTWRFEPAVVCGKVRAVNMNVEVTFRPD